MSARIRMPVHMSAHMRMRSVALTRFFQLYEYHKNLGHGTKLIEKVLKWKSECEDSRPLVLKVARANIGAVKLYKKFGFVETDAPDPKWHIADDHFWLTF